MATDWLVYLLLGPIGLGLMGLAALISFWIWRSVLGGSWPAVGWSPLAAGCSAAMLGLATASFLSAYADFSERVRIGPLSESQRWEIVPGWTIYIMVVSLVVVLPLVGLVGAPLCASLLRRRRLTVLSMLGSVTTLWLALSIIAWVFPGNDWQKAHRLEYFKVLLSSFAFGISLVALPFMLGVYFATRAYRRTSVRDS